MKVRRITRYDKANNLIEIYEIPYTTTTEAIIDKVAELIKAGKAKEIADMRDETDLERPETDHRSQTRHRSGQADAAPVPPDDSAGQHELQL